ncbi:Protein cortex-like Protein [Tribolium castaneum]|uniref:Protein cortex-like Protein n=1 Tax=Tribolium castaneum TaxID=7070 RepID=D6WE73_TRICA|nr:PREDICTED: cell division cycle protein 20 homolog [Tribolium castaneum]EFA01168.2 Protein cortex-like Protein [Tribolium castaneum]|eukprot:XP_008199269.2 PREDICTED: cell division cycle protein 20 homolog [Tribolium castaneum]
MLRLSNSVRNSCDRFIPLRLNDEISPDPSNFDPLDHEVLENTGFINYAKIRYNRNNYKNALRSALLPYEPKVLNFFPPKKFKVKKTPGMEHTWPVKPREKPVIGLPKTVLDMPQFDSTIFHHVCDWSSEGCIATIFQNEVHIWNHVTQRRIRITSTTHRIEYSIKWKNGGTQFAVGLFPSSVGIWDVVANKLICWESCGHYAHKCKVFALEWINAQLLVTGCSLGSLKVFNSELNKIRESTFAHTGAILTIVRSCDGRFIATTGMDKMMIVWRIPTLEKHFTFETDTISRAVAWHPWRGSLLAVGVGQRNGHIVIFNINKKSSIAEEKFTYRNATVNSLTFNPISGELVASYFVRDARDRRKGVGVVVVFSNIDRIEEELHLHDGPILYLLWGNKGRNLASASADENLCIWDFFGKMDEQSQNGRKKKEKNTPTSSVLRSTIR